MKKCHQCKKSKPVPPLCPSCTFYLISSSLPPSSSLLFPPPNYILSPSHSQLLLKQTWLKARLEAMVRKNLNFFLKKGAGRMGELQLKKRISDLEKEGIRMKDQINILNKRKRSLEDRTASKDRLLIEFESKIQILKNLISKNQHIIIKKYQEKSSLRKKILIYYSKILKINTIYPDWEVLKEFEVSEPKKIEGQFEIYDEKTINDLNNDDHEKITTVEQTCIQLTKKKESINIFYGKIIRESVNNIGKMLFFIGDTERLTFPIRMRIKGNEVLFRNLNGEGRYYSFFNEWDDFLRTIELLLLNFKFLFLKTKNNCQKYDNIISKDSTTNFSITCPKKSDTNLNKKDEVCEQIFLVNEERRDTRKENEIDFFSSFQLEVIDKKSEQGIISKNQNFKIAQNINIDIKQEYTWLDFKFLLSLFLEERQMNIKMKKLSNLKSGEINYAEEYSKIEEIERQEKFDDSFEIVDEKAFFEIE